MEQILYFNLSQKAAERSFVLEILFVWRKDTAS